MIFKASQQQVALVGGLCAIRKPDPNKAYLETDYLNPDYSEKYATIIFLNGIIETIEFIGSDL